MDIGSNGFKLPTNGLLAKSELIDMAVTALDFANTNVFAFIKDASRLWQNSSVEKILKWGIYKITFAIISSAVACPFKAVWKDVKKTTINTGFLLNLLKNKIIK